MLWQVDIYPAENQPDIDAHRVIASARDLGLSSDLKVCTARGYLIQGPARRAEIQRLADQLLADAIVETTLVGPVGQPELNKCARSAQLIHVLLRPGVMDPVAQSAQAAIADYGVATEAVRTFRKYWLDGIDADTASQLATKLLANDSIEQIICGALELDRIDLGSDYQFRRNQVPLRELTEEGLQRLSLSGQLYLSLAEMQTIQAHFQALDRDPTDVELETVAQTWSEHCSHKTLAGRIVYRDEHGQRRFENMLRETIFAATGKIRQSLGGQDWCVSVFQDNAGIVRFDDDDNVVFKVETHNHPSALEPYGGANTGIGGVIRDPLGTGMGAKPICNTDVFCFAPPDTPAATLPPGILHPRRVISGVVAGVRDYGNRMGIPTVNGAVYFDERYLGNPLVYCGNVGILPRDKSRKQPLANDFIVALGGRTGRDGIHGATFSSAELTSESETISGGAVQIGNALTEKMLLDVLLAARDQNLYTAVTDCGAGGFSSAVGEMGEKIGAEVWLDRVPLKYAGLSYTEIWISEAQERMVLSVPPEKWDALAALCAAEEVEATIIGRFTPTQRLTLKYGEHQVGDLSMHFLHDGRPPVVREAIYVPPTVAEMALPAANEIDFTRDLQRILSSLNVCSKHWIIRQYDHEVQGGSAIKPLVGLHEDGPSDAAVVRPKLSSRRGLVVSCGMNPRYGDLDTYHMAASAIDEALRNNVAVGADPARIAILDNFCWGYTDRPETLGSLVRAAIACHDVAVALGTPFISGKDSLNNEFSYADATGKRSTIAIPPSLLISALGQVDDVRQCVTMDFKQAGNRLYLVGLTKPELGGSHFGLLYQLSGGRVPVVETAHAKATFAAVHRAIRSGCVRACHDLSEGGLAVAVAEMAFAGGLGAEVDLSGVPHEGLADDLTARRIGLLFSESNTRFLCEVPEARAANFEQLLEGVPLGLLGYVREDPMLYIRDGGSAPQGAVRDQASSALIQASLPELKQAWLAPLDW